MTTTPRPIVTQVRTGVAQEVIRQEDTIRERTRQAFLARRRAER